MSLKLIWILILKSVNFSFYLIKPISDEPSLDYLTASSIDLSQPYISNEPLIYLSQPNISDESLIDFLMTLE